MSEAHDELSQETETEEEAREKRAAFEYRAKLIRELLCDPNANEMAINRPGEVDLMIGGQWVTRDAPGLTFEYMLAFGRNLANLSGGKSFDRENTSLSGFMPTGERVELTHPPQSPEGIIYANIRKHADQNFNHDDLVKQGYYDNVQHQMSLSMTKDRREELYEYLTDDEKRLWKLATEKNWAEFMVESVLTFQNIAVSGATAAGKSAYSLSLVEKIPTNERVVTIQDTPEMPMPNHRHSIELFFKKSAADKEGATAKEVLHSVMRKTPKRVLFAELRGDEAMFYLSSVLGSGHPGGITTTHANSPRDAFFRLALLILSSDEGRGLGLDTVLMLLYMQVNVIVQLVNQNGRRFVPAIYYDPMHRLSLLG